MDFNRFKVILIAVFGVFIAIYLGVASATAMTEAIFWVGGGLLIAFLLTLGRHVWVLIPIFAVLGGTLTFIPGYPAPWYAVTPVAAAMLLARFLMRARNFTYQFCWMDVAIALQVLALLQAYMRNPTGLAILGSSSVIGGRPYVDYSVAIFSYFLLATVKTELAVIKRVVIAMIILALCDEFIKSATGFSGTLARAVSAVYSNVDYTASEAGAKYSYEIGTTRFSSLAGLGVVISLVLFSFNRPLHCVLPMRPLQFVALMFATAVTMLSGFRSGLIKMGFYFVGSTLVRRRTADLVAGGAAAFVMLAVVVASGSVKSLPNAAQRALSFLPIGVDEDVKRSADGSAEWRYEMWRLVLTTDRYIQNKWLGDGFGFSAAEHEAQMQEAMGMHNYRGDSIDAFIAKGSYHGWHVEAIRFTGTLGLVIGVVILVMFARVGWRLIRHHENTPFMPYAIYICLPFVIEPFFTLLVFGSYKGSFITFIAMSGVLRVLYGLYLEEVRAAATAKAEETTDSRSSRLPPWLRQRPLLNTRG